MIEHTNITIRHLLESWHPTVREMDRLELTFNQRVFAQYSTVVVVQIAEDGYFVGLSVEPTREEVRGMAEVASRMQLRLIPQGRDKLQDYLRINGPWASQWQAVGLPMMSLASRGRLFKVIKDD